MPRGGSRPGAGRKPLREKYERHINQAEKKIADKLPQLVDVLMKQALGQILVQEELEDGPEIHAVAPDRKAGEYLVNRILGRPTEHHELTGADGGPIEFDDLSDTERAARAAAILELARTRRAGQAAPPSQSV